MELVLSHIRGLEGLYMHVVALEELPDLKGALFMGKIGFTGLEKSVVAKGLELMDWEPKDDPFGMLIFHIIDGSWYYRRAFCSDL